MTPPLEGAPENMINERSEQNFPSVSRTSHHRSEALPAGLAARLDQAQPQPIGFIDQAPVLKTAEGLARWLFSGALSHSDGAIAAWRDHATQELAYEYPEITGYLLTAAAFTGRTDDPRVRQAADWLCDRVERGVLHSRASDGPVIYNFDTAIVAAGLLNFGSATSGNRYLDTSIRLAVRLRDQPLRRGWLPTLDPDSTVPTREASWSTTGRVHLLKATQALCLASEHGVDCMIEAAELVVDDVVRRFSLDGEDLRGPDGRTYLHPACYALEGLWIWSVARDSVTHLDLARKVFDEILAFRLPSGGFPRSAGGSEAEEQTDVVAQMTRLALLLGRNEEADKGLARLSELTLPAPPGVALVYAPLSTHVHESSWSSMFALQAFELATQPTLDWRQLI
jgi:hypothetical protein